MGGLQPRENGADGGRREGLELGHSDSAIHRASPSRAMARRGKPGRGLRNTGGGGRLNPLVESNESSIQQISFIIILHGCIRVMYLNGESGAGAGFEAALAAPRGIPRDAEPDDASPHGENGFAIASRARGARDQSPGMAGQAVTQSSFVRGVRDPADRQAGGPPHENITNRSCHECWERSKSHAES